MILSCFAAVGPFSQTLCRHRISSMGVYGVGIRQQYIHISRPCSEPPWYPCIRGLKTCLPSTQTIGVTTQLRTMPRVQLIEHSTVLNPARRLHKLPFGFENPLDGGHGLQPHSHTCFLSTSRPRVAGLCVAWHAVRQPCDGGLSGDNNTRHT